MAKKKRGILYKSSVVFVILSIAGIIFNYGIKYGEWKEGKKLGIVGAKEPNNIIEVTKTVNEYPEGFVTYIDNKVTVIDIDTNFNNSWFTYWNIYTDINTTQKIRMSTNITLPYDFKELHKNAFEFQYIYGTPDTTNQKVHLTKYKDGNSNILAETTFPFSINWNSYIINKSKLNSSIDLEPNNKIIILFDIIVKKGSPIGIGFIKYSYIN